MRNARCERKRKTRTYVHRMSWFVFAIIIILSACVIVLTFMQPPASAQEGASTLLNLSRKEQRLCVLTVVGALALAACALVWG